MRMRVTYRATFSGEVVVEGDDWTDAVFAFNAVPLDDLVAAATEVELDPRTVHHDETGERLL